MAVAVIIELAGMTAESHNALVEAMGISGQPASAIPGLIFHMAGPTEKGWRVIDVWESQEDMERFQRERLMPAAAKLGGLPHAEVRNLRPTDIATGAERCLCPGFVCDDGRGAGEPFSGTESPAWPDGDRARPRSRTARSASRPACLLPG